MAEQPSLVSVIIPVYNGDSFISDAIQSVLTQSYKSVEIIVVDDGSTDKSAAVVRQFSSVQYIFQENAGISAARNKGVAHSEGDYLAFLDADDVWLDEKLELQTAAFKENPNLDVIFGHVRQFRGQYIANTALAAAELMPGYIPSTMLIKRDTFSQVGLFETNWKMGEFASWYLRSLEQGLKNMMLPDLVALRRLHDTNNGIQQRESIKDYVRILKASLDRRRVTTPEQKALTQEESKITKRRFL